MRIGGLQKFSLIDYPGKMAAIIFSQGCNFRCPFCHNPELVDPKLYRELIPEEKVLAFLRKRQGKLGGVVISGGEPTLQSDLISFLDKIRCLGYFIKLDTNGSHPEVLEKIIDLRLVNYVAMDIKAPLKKYNTAAGVSVSGDSIKESIRVIISSGIAHQFRTTLVKPLCSAADIQDMRLLVGGAQEYTLQSFVPHDHIFDKNLLTQENYTPKEIQEFQHELAFPKI